LTPLRDIFPPAYQAAAEEEEGAAQRVDEIQTRVAEQRNKFFEQIALLSGGAIVLSVSLLSTLFGKVVLHLVVVLILGWAELLLALMASFYRASKYQSYMLEVSMRQYMNALAQKKIVLYQQAKQGQKVMSSLDEEGMTRVLSADKLKEEATEIFKDGKLRKKWADEHFKRVRFAETFAVIAFWFGVLSLAIFASVNIFKATLISQAPSIQYIFDRL
jgi:hypothetical protein